MWVSGLRGCFLLAFVSLFLSIPSGASQTTGTATVLGTVMDPAGAVIPGATIELTDLATNQSRSQMTNVRSDQAPIQL